MKKIISLFQRNYDGDKLVRNELVPGTEWVRDGQGVATRKWDGTCCMVKDGKLYKRYDAKSGRVPPQGFIPAQDADAQTGHWPGWLPIDKYKPEDKWHIVAWQKQPFEDGTYELIGPRINGNPERTAEHLFIRHGVDKLPSAPRDFYGLKNYLEMPNIEGIVWWHEDGRMVKIKGKDFGIKRGTNL